MAVAMEVVPWRAGAEVQGSKRKKRAWGADAQQLMMGQNVPSQSVAADLTLDLLGRCSGRAADGSASRSGSGGIKVECLPEFRQLDVPEDDSPLPPGWQKCLDLQTGRLYYVNRSSGMSTFNDPRKRSTNTNLSQTEAPNTSPLSAHEFLGSKKSETLKQAISRVPARASCSSSSGVSNPHLNTIHNSPQLLSLGSTCHHVKPYLHRSASCPSMAAQEQEESNLELDLNLSPSHRYEQTVCTMQMVQNALQRTQKSMPRSVSSSLSSLTHFTHSPSDQPHSSGNGAISVSTSSSSSTSSRSSARVKCEAESVKVDVVDSRKGNGNALVMGACTRCLMYVMLSKGELRCPRCDGQVPVEFGSTAFKSLRQRVCSSSHFGLDRR